MVAGKGKAPAVKEEHEEPVHRESDLLGPLRLTRKDLTMIRSLPSGSAQLGWASMPIPDKISFGPEVDWGEPHP